MPANPIDVAVPVVAASLVFGYHAWFALRVAANPAATVYGLNANARRAWVASVMLKKQDILAVQSLRNWVMAASALASVAIAIVFGFVAFVANVATHAETTAEDNPLHSDFGFILDDLFIYKVLVILSVNFAAFFCFLNAIRFYNHVALVINS
ncbi:hypothetical protein HK405_015404 [Cladochytrium tenue]|nr:hypothetical protein HK405_015404 [Cladochytrium tenue]